MNTKEQVAERLIYPLFRCLDESYKTKYVRNIWEQFENGIRSAAYTSSLTVFLENITRKLPIEVQAKYLSEIMPIVQSGEDEQILDWLREETTYLTMLARLANQERKEAYGN